MNIHGARFGNNFSASRRVLAWKSYSGSCGTMHFWYFDLNFHHPFFLCHTFIPVDWYLPVDSLVGLARVVIRKEAF